MNIIVGRMIVDPEGRVGLVTWQTPAALVSWVQYVNNGLQHRYLTSNLRLATGKEIYDAGLSGVGQEPAPGEE